MQKNNNLNYENYCGCIQFKLNSLMKFDEYSKVRYITNSLRRFIYYKIKNLTGFVMQICKKCGRKGRFLGLSDRGYCKECESDLQYLNSLNDESVINTSEEHFKEVIKDGILMLIPAIIIIILIYSIF